MKKSVWLRCKVSPGQFTGEYAIVAKDFKGSTFSFFAPDAYVHCDSDASEAGAVDGMVQVEVLEQSSDLILVRLPRVALENGQTVTVCRSDVTRKMAREPA